MWDPITQIIANVKRRCCWAQWFSAAAPLRDWMFFFPLLCFCRVLPWHWCGAIQPNKGWVCSSRDKQSSIFGPDLSSRASGDHSRVRSHLSPCIALWDQTFFFSRRTAHPDEELCRPCHLNMARGLANVHNVTVFPSAERLSFQPEQLKRYMDCRQWCSQTRCLSPSIPPLCARSPLSNELMLLEITTDDIIVFSINSWLYLPLSHAAYSWYWFYWLWFKCVFDTWWSITLM